MSAFDAFRYEGKRALVVGGATGMGAAVSRLAVDAGADVVVMDRAPVEQSGVQAITLDLSELDSTDAALDALGGPVDVVFSCAGVADGTPGIERINFIGHRYMIDRLIERGWLSRGGAIGMISSAAGLGWEADLDLLVEFLAIEDWDAAVAWVAEHGKADYLSMKRAMCAYVAAQARPMLARGIRINAVCPGPTDTPLAQANAEMWLDFGSDYRADVGIEASTPEEQAAVLVFLCSDAASAVNGQTVVSDAGYLASGLAHSFEPAVPVAEFLYGRFG
jgi:NAD(P)-dependent dehydrogenase (short-subunit alcohol dehydrogenase family)